MQIFTSQVLTAHQKEKAYQLWNNEYPQQLKYAHIAQFDEYLKGLDDLIHYLLFNSEESMVGWAATFNRNSEKWFAIIVDSSIQGEGYGTAMLNAIKGNEQCLVGWAINHDGDTKLNGHPYPSPVAFYLKNQFCVIESCRLETEQISAVKIGWKEATK